AAPPADGIAARRSRQSRRTNGPSRIMGAPVGNVLRGVPEPATDATTPECGASLRLHRPRIGLVAGWGRLPIVLAESLHCRGFEICCLGIKTHAAAALEQVCEEFAWAGLSKLGRAIRHFRRREIREATLAGKIHKVLLYRPRAWLEYWPDWRTLRTF